MADLDDDLARVARLRGRDPANYQRDQVDVQTLMEKLDPAAVRAVFFFPRNGDTFADIEIYDALPARSRALLREATINICAERYTELLEVAEGDQKSLVGLLSQVIPMQVQSWLRKHYGKKHPNLTENR